MKSHIKEILLCLFIFFFVLAVKGQEPIDLSLPVPSEDDQTVCGLTTFAFAEINVSVWSRKKGYLKDLTYKDFRVYDEKELQEIEYFKFDELKNQYTIGFHQKYFIPDDKWRDLKVKVKLPEVKKKHYGKIFVRAQNGYYSNQN